MPSYGPEPETPGARRQIGLAAGVLVLALSVPYMSDGFQQEVALALQGSVLAPFIAMQERLSEGRARADEIDFLQAELDSLVAMSTTQAALADENRELRELLGLAERAGTRFRPATVLRPGTPGSESMFWVDVGAADGVVEGAPVVNARGLVGVIREVRERSAVAIDWTHPDFGVSAMLADGGAFGLVEVQRGDFREEDRLLLNGTAYHETAAQGALVVTSGLGNMFPRGIPIGRIDATAEVQGSWRKSYWLRPEVQPGSVTHVLVEAGPTDSDLSPMWAVDSVAATPAPPRREPAARQPTPSPTPPTQPVPARRDPEPTPQVAPSAQPEARPSPPPTQAEPPAAQPSGTLPPTPGLAPDSTSISPVEAADSIRTEPADSPSVTPSDPAAPLPTPSLTPSSTASPVPPSTDPPAAPPTDSANPG